MGVITHIASEVDRQEQIQYIYATTRFEISSRATLNRLANRASIETGAGQRTLVAAAYDTVGLDMVWREGPFSTMTPEEKWPDAQDITFEKIPIEKSSEFFDITDIPEDAVPRGRLGDLLLEGINNFRPETVLYVWGIPYEVGGRL